MRHTKNIFFFAHVFFRRTLYGIWNTTKKNCLCALLKVIYGLAALLNPDVIWTMPRRALHAALFSFPRRKNCWMSWWLEGTGWWWLRLKCWRCMLSGCQNLHYHPIKLPKNPISYILFNKFIYLIKLCAYVSA